MKFLGQGFRKLALEHSRSVDTLTRASECIAVEHSSMTTGNVNMKIKAVEHKNFKQVCQLSRLAYIPTCRSTQRWLTRCSVVTRHRPLCHTWLATVQCIIALCFRALGANPWAKIHQNRS